MRPGKVVVEGWWWRRRRRYCGVVVGSIETLGCVKFVIHDFH